MSPTINNRGNPRLLIVGVPILRLIIVESTIIKRRLRILRLIIVESSYDADLLSTTNISRDHPPAAITKKTSHPKTTSYRACSEIKVIQPKCWRDKLNVKLSVYELSVLTDDIFNVFYSSTKSNRRAWMSLPWNKSAAFNAKINNFTKRLSW